MKRFRITFTGAVQGVSFRYYTKQKAQELGLNGYVKNLEDGRVELVAEGHESDIKNLISYCKTDIKHASISNVDIQEEPMTGKFHIFEIKF